MGEVGMGSALKKTLKSFCCSNGWSYGVFWSFDKRNSMLLTLEDAYYEEQMAAMVGDMLLQVHKIAEGIIGEAALTGSKKWIFSDSHNGENGQYSSSNSQDNSDFHHQFFSSGIQTIAVVPVGSRGVLQFGSTKKMLESLEFLDQTRRLFEEVENFDGLVQLENTPPLLNDETTDLNAIFASILSSGNDFMEILAPLHAGSSTELTRDPCSLANLTHSSAFEPEIDTNPLHIDSPYLCIPSQAPCISSLSDEGSILTSFEKSFPSESMIQDSPNFCSRKTNIPIQNFQQESTFTSIYNPEETVPSSSVKMMENQHSTQLFLETQDDLPDVANSLERLEEDFQWSDFTTDQSCYEGGELSQWFTPSPDHSFHILGTPMENNLLHSEAAPVSSSIIEGNVPVDIPTKHSCNSVRSSITDAFMYDGQEKFEIVHGAKDDLFEALGIDSGCSQAGKHWENNITPAVSGGCSVIGTGVSGYTTELDVGSMAGHRKGLFSGLGLEEILSSVTNSSHPSKCNSMDQLSTTKRRKVESSSSSSNCVQWTKLPCSAGGMSLVHDVLKQDKNNLVHDVLKQDKNNLVHKKEVLPKSQVGLWIDDSYSINAEKAVAASPKKPEKPVKVSRKRARPGESTRPRPKDRQQIQDRLKELRGIIPNGAKCSIDSLLDLTIKHMLFLQSITKYADKLKEVEEPKLIGQQNGVVLKDKSTRGHTASGGATWAFEIGGQTMICPIIVEDLSPPGQMLIEMLCEDRGFFLEIADMIKGFGLNIWKGVMERQEDKIWARFIVEANRHVTRMDIFWSLVQLLQQTTTSGVNSMNQPNNAMDDRFPLSDSYQQQPLLPVAASHQLG